MKKFIRRIFRRPAIAVVTIWANYTYKKIVKIADERHRREHTMIYVASQSFHPDMLTTYDRRRFKIEKSVYGWQARLLTLQSLKNGCYYHTPDKVGNQALSEKEKERRRKAFVKERLKLAKLI